MNASEMALLRTKLREVNIEYSAQVRMQAGEGRFARMGELRVERQALMALIAQARGETRERPRIPPALAPLKAAIQYAVGHGLARST